MQVKDTNWKTSLTSIKNSNQFKQGDNWVKKNGIWVKEYQPSLAFDDYIVVFELAKKVDSSTTLVLSGSPANMFSYDLMGANQAVLKTTNNTTAAKLLDVTADHKYLGIKSLAANTSGKLGGRPLFSSNSLVTKILKLDPEDYTSIFYPLVRSSLLVSVPPVLPPSVVSLQSAFTGATNFNDPNISQWDMKNVTTLAQLFYNCPNFNQPLDNWDVSKVGNFSGIFSNSTSFNQPLDSWNVANGAIFSQMFQGASKFNQPLSSWDVSNGTNFQAMFRFATTMAQDLSMWVPTKATSWGQFYEDSGMTSAQVPAAFR